MQKGVYTSIDHLCASCKMNRILSIQATFFLIILDHFTNSKWAICSKIKVKHILGKIIHY